MSCKYNAPNGKKSELYDDLYNKFGHETAFKNWATVATPSFKEWYGDGALDANGEPVTKDNTHFLNDKGETRPLTKLGLEKNPISLEAASNQIEQLTALFGGHGINVEVSFDSDIKDAGQVYTLNGKTKIKFNPRRMRKDSVFHEFGHMYTDLISNTRMYDKGIEHLKGSELWEKVAKLYPELSDKQLAKEVLTTAIGIEAAKQYDERARIRRLKKGGLLDKIKGWGAWFTQMLQHVADNLGITKNLARRLAWDLTGGKLRSTLTGQLSSRVQKQKAPDINKLIADGKRTVLNPKETHYVSPVTKTELLRVTAALDGIKGIFERDAVIKKLIQHTTGEFARFNSETELGMFWADKREEGTGIHNLAEDYINARKASKTVAQAKKMALDNLHVPRAGLDADGIRFYEGMNPEYVKAYADNMINFIEGLTRQGYELYPEVKVFDDEMGVAGTIDLLIKKPNGKYMIWDWKTKEQGKFDKFYKLSSYEVFNGLMSDIGRSKASEYSLQLSTYALILERQGFEVESLAIIPLVGTAMTNAEGETHYMDVDLATGINGLVDGVLPLVSLSDRLKDVYQVPNDLEGDLELLAESDEINENNASRIAALEHTSIWLKELLVDLEKSIARIRATGEKEGAAKFEKGLKKLIDEIDVADESMAIAAYAKYVAKITAGLYKKFNPGLLDVTQEDGSVVRTIVPGYDSWTWHDIKALEESDPKKYMEFLAFMINANMALEQVVKIEKLPRTLGTEMNIVWSTLKQQQVDISDLMWKMNRLNKELDQRYVELSSNPLYGGRGVLHGTEDFMKAQTDETYMQRNVDAMADTHNSYLANVMRMYDYKMRTMEDEAKLVSKDWLDKVAEIEATGSSLDRFVDKSTGKTITRVDWADFYRDRAAAYHRANEHEKGSAEWRAEVNAFYETAVVMLSDEKIEEIRAAKEEELSAAGYNKWLNQNLYTTKAGTHWKRTSPMYVPSDSYMNQTYKSYSQSEIEFHKYLTGLLASLVDHTKGSIIKYGYMPAVPKNQKGFMEQFLSNMGWRDSGSYNADLGMIVNEVGEVVNFLPFQYNSLLKQEPLEELPPNSSLEAKLANEETNKAIKKANAAAHAAAIDQDLSKTMPIFIRAAIKHKHKKAMEFELLRVKRSFEKNHRIKVMKNGKPVIDKMKNMRGLENNEVEKSTIGSKVAEHYDDWLRMIFYEEFELDEGNWQKVARVLQNYTSFKSMAFNVYSSINNQTYGEIMSGIESAAGEFFGKEDWAWSTGEYLSGAVSYFADDEASMSYSSKQSAFMHHVPIMMDFMELAPNENVNESTTNVLLKKMGTGFSKAYFMEHASEHNLQNRVLLSMARSHKVIDGVIVDFKTYKRGKLEPLTKEMIKEDPANAREVMARNIEKTKTLQEEFNKNTSLYEAYEFDDGKLKLKEGLELKKDEIAEFQRKVLGVNHYLHGIYNKEDAGAMQQYALGRLAMQFKKWMRPGWNKRFGTHFGKSFWNERRSMVDEGMYVTTFNFFTQPIKDGIKDYKDDDQATFMKAIGNIVSDYGTYFANIRVHWHTLNDTQRANVIRTALEYVAFASAIGTAALLKEIKGDDEDPPFALMLALYQADRTATELTTYVPLAVIPGVYAGGGWFNESKKLLKSPMATFNTIESAIKIGKELMMYPFADMADTQYKGGVYAGQSKLAVQSQKMIPLWNQIMKFENMAKNYKYYKLF